MKSLSFFLIVLLFSFSSCSRLIIIKKTDNTTLSLNYEIKTTNKIPDNLKACNEAYYVIKKLIPDLDNDNCLALFYDFKSKVKKIKDGYIHNYKFKADFSRYLKEDYIFSILFVLDDDLYNFKDNIKLNFARWDIKKKDEIYNEKLYDYIIRINSSFYEIESVAGKIYFSSATLDVLKTFENFSFNISANSSSRISKQNCNELLIQEISNKLEQNRDLFLMNFYTLRFYKANNISSLASVEKFLNGIGKRYYISKLNNDYIEVKISFPKNKSVEELASMVIKEIKDVNIDFIDVENKTAVFYFSKSMVGII